MNKRNLPTWSKLQIFITSIGVIFTVIAFILKISPKYAGKIDAKLFPFFNHISWFQWILLFIAMWTVIVLVLIWAEKQKIKSEIVDFLPRIKFVNCGIDRVDKNREIYGEDSFLTKYLRSKRELIYFDVANVPLKKDKEKGTAKDVSYWIEIYDYDQETLTYKKYQAKWVAPESKDTIDIIPTQYGKRIGLGFMDGNGSIYILDASATYDKDGFSSQLNHLNNYGKFVFSAQISTSNDIYDSSPLFFLIENVRDKPPKITKMEDGELWVKIVKQANNDLWKNIIEKNKKNPL